MPEIRSVSVRLDADVASYIAKMRLAGQETDKAFGKSDESIRRVNTGLSGTERELGKVDTQARKVDTSMRRVGSSVDQTRTKVDTGAKSIDRLSGRLGVLTDVALGVGPALIPIAAEAVPLTAALGANLGFIGVGAGTAVLAFHGVGDALKAVNKAGLEPTAANLQAADDAMNQLSPSAQRLVLDLHRLTPELQGLQRVAADGLLPGVSDGLDALQGALPLVRRGLRDVSGELGVLARDTGMALGSKEWTPFLRFLDQEAPVALDQMGRSVGHLAHGGAELVMAFQPLTGRIDAGILNLTRDFDRWASSLGRTQGFQDFLAYLEQNGPRVLALLGATGKALVDIGTAVAPLGGPVLDVLTRFVNVIDDVAKSDLGTPLFAGIVAFRLYARVAQLAGVQVDTSFKGMARGPAQMTAGLDRLRVTTTSWATQTRADLAEVATGYRLLGTGYGKVGDQEAIGRLKAQGAQFAKTGALAGGLALVMTGTADKIGLSNTATLAMAGSLGGVWTAAALGAVGLTMDLAHSNDDLADAEARATAAILEGGGSLKQQQAELDALRAKTQAYKDSVHDAFAFDVGSPKDTLTAFGDLFTHEGARASAQVDYLKGHIRDLRHETGGLGDVFSQQLGLTSHALDVATASERSFVAEFQHLSNVLEGRSTFRDYRAAIDGVSASLKQNGRGLSPFNAGGRANQAALDQIATTGLAFAQTLKGVDRIDFLAGLRKHLISANEAFGGSKQHAEDYVSSLRDLNKLRVNPKVDADTKPAHQKIDATKAELRALTHQPFDLLMGADKKAADASLSALESRVRDLTGPSHLVKVSANTGAALQDLRALAAAEAALRNKTITITTEHATGGRTVATGGYITGPGSATSDSIPARLSNGEFVMRAAAVDQYGLGFMHAVNATRFADGGPVQTHVTSSPGGVVAGSSGFGAATRDATNALHGLKAESASLTQTLAAEKAERDKIAQQRQQLVQTVRDGFRTQLFGATADGSSVWDQGGGLTDPLSILNHNIHDARTYTRDLGRLRRRGLRGGALAQVTTLAQAQQALGLDPSELRKITAREQVLQHASQQAGRTAGNFEFGKHLASIDAEVHRLAERLHMTDHEIKAREHARAAAAKHHAQEAGKAAAGAVTGAVTDGNRRRRPW